MKRIIKLTESDLEQIVKKVIKEQTGPGLTSFTSPYNYSFSLPNKEKSLIIQAQNALIKKGYSVGPKGADGFMGQNTINAIKKYQKNNGIKQTGTVGPITAKSLGVEPLVGSKISTQNNQTQPKVGDEKTSIEGTLQKIKSKLTSYIEPGVSSFLRKRFPNIVQVLSGRELSPNDFTSNQKNTLVNAIKNSQKRANQQKSGSVDYIDYGQDVSKTFENEKGSPSNWDVVWNSVTNNDRFAMATLFGKFSWVKNPDGSYTIDDKYDFKNPKYEQISGINRKTLEGKSIGQLKKEYGLGSYEAVRVKAWVDYPEEIPGRAIPLKITINPSEFA
jgi:peptidoglycan hydrolase-like protein with peptidoglycan-binding domain